MGTANPQGKRKELGPNPIYSILQPLARVRICRCYLSGNAIPTGVPIFPARCGRISNRMRLLFSNHRKLPASGRFASFVTASIMSARVRSANGFWNLGLAFIPSRRVFHGCALCVSCNGVLDFGNRGNTAAGGLLQARSIFRVCVVILQLMVLGGLQEASPIIPIISERVRA
jgi:hypothetical protein